MKRRALLVGSQIAGLAGVHHDVAAMQRILEGYGFEVDRRTGADATRAGILDGYARLTTDSRVGDAAVVYYSGHGAYARARARLGGAARERHLQCIVPTDWGEGGEFRGILDVELSQLLAALTARIDNVAVVLDCCHAAYMSREPAGPAFVRRSLGAAWADGVEEFVLRHAIDIVGPATASNPRAVRLVATEVDRSAYEAVDPSNPRQTSMGLLTQALRNALGEVGGAPVSWHALALRVRELVIARQPRQRPDVEGPADRLLFSTASTARPEAVIFFYDEGRPALRAGALQGARVGAVYEILPTSGTLRGAAQPRALAEATVTEVSGPCAHVALRLFTRAAELPAGALALPRELPFNRLDVAIHGEDTALLPVLAGIHGSRYLELAPPGGTALFEVVVEPASLELRNDEGDVLLRSTAADRAAQLVVALERQARAEALRRLPDGGLTAAATSVRVDRVTDGCACPLDPGEMLHVGDSLAVTVENLTRDTDLHVAVFDLDIDGTVRLLTELTPSGRRLAPGERVAFPEGRGRVLGFPPLEWPAIVPSDGARTRSLMVVIADHWHEFRLLQTARGTLHRSGSPLEALLDSVRDGSVRGFAPAGVAEARQRGGRHLVVRIDFRLSPTHRSHEVASG